MRKSQFLSKNFKGQAATEFLVTYGWAIVIVFAIMAILYSTIFKPEFYVAERCDIAPGISCESFMLTKVNGNANLTLRAINTMGFPINITYVGFLLEDSSGMDKISANLSKSELDNINPIANGASFNLTKLFIFSPSSVKGSGSLYKVYFTINFTNNAVSPPTNHTTAGIINVRVS